MLEFIDIEDFDSLNAEQLKEQISLREKQIEETQDYMDKNLDALYEDPEIYLHYCEIIHDIEHEISLLHDFLN